MKLSTPKKNQVRRASAAQISSQTLQNIALRQGLKISPANYSKRSSVQRTLDMDYIFRLLRKSKFDRNKQDNKYISKVLVSKYEYFKKIKHESEGKLEKIISVLTLEEFEKDEAIIKFGEEGTKFYVLLSGKVSIWKPEYVKQKMTMYQFISYLNMSLKSDPSGILKQRLIEQNKFLGDDFLSKLDKDIKTVNNKIIYDVLIEQNVKLTELGDGFSFGDTALLRKTKRNATIISETRTLLVSMEKNDYNQIIKELEEKRLRIELRKFKEKFPLFDEWNYIQIMKLLSFMTDITLTQGDYLYKQNEPSDYIYFSLEGKFEVYTLTSVAWNNLLVNYIKDPYTNFLNLLRGRKEKTSKELMDLFQDASAKVLPSPMCSRELKSGEFAEKGKKGKTISLNELNREIEKMKDPFNLIKIKLSNITENMIIGLEDAIELKNRFNFVKVISKFAKLKMVRRYDFIKVLNENNAILGNNAFLINFVDFKKNVLLDSINNIIGNYKETKNKKIENELKRCVALGGNNNNIKKSHSLKYIKKNENNEEDNNYILKTPIITFYKTQSTFLNAEKSNNSTNNSIEKYRYNIKKPKLLNIKTPQNFLIKDKYSNINLNTDSYSKFQSNKKPLTESKRYNSYNSTLKSENDEEIGFGGYIRKDEYNSPLLYNQSLNIEKLDYRFNKNNKKIGHYSIWGRDKITKFNTNTISKNFTHYYRNKIRLMEYRKMNSEIKANLHSKFNNIKNNNNINKYNNSIGHNNKYSDNRESKLNTLLFNYTRNKYSVKNKLNFKSSFDFKKDNLNNKSSSLFNNNNTLKNSLKIDISNNYSISTNMNNNTFYVENNKEMDSEIYRKKLCLNKNFFKKELKKYVGFLKLKPKIKKYNNIYEDLYEDDKDNTSNNSCNHSINDKISKDKTKKHNIINNKYYRNNNIYKHNKDYKNKNNNRGYSNVSLKDIDEKINAIKYQINTRKYKGKSNDKYMINYLNDGIKIQVIKNRTQGCQTNDK